MVCDTCKKESNLEIGVIKLEFQSNNPLLASNHEFDKIMCLKEWIDKQIR